jgi:hypothetical protein
MQSEAPEVTWLIMTTIGVLVLGGAIAWTMLRYKAWRERRARQSRPTD